MTTIPNPIYRVLEVAEPDEIDQPKPPAEVAAFTQIDLVPVTEPCERCGCHWIGDPETWIPEGNAECAYCRMWRGSVSRDTTLSEFADDGPDPTLDRESDDPQGGTLEALMVEGIPVYDPAAMGVDEDAVGVVDMVQEGEDA
jgi:hypothetical protein